MAQAIERLLETTVEQLHTFLKLKVVTEHEAKQVARRRRNLERALLQKEVTPKHYFRYIQYEHNVQLLLKRRMKNLGAKALTRSEKRILKRALFQQTSRVFFLFNRASRKFPMDWTVWKSYFKYCLQTSSFRLASRVLGRALARLPNLEELWLLAISFEFDHRKNMRAARIIAQRSLRQLINSQLLWREYFRIELYYLCRQIFQRQYLGLPIPQKEERDVSHSKDIFSDETNHGQILLRDDDASEDDREEDQLALDEEFNLAYQDSVSEESSSSAPERTSSVSFSFWEGGVVLLVFKHILGRWKTEDSFLASLVELVMETPFSPQVLKNEIRNLVLFHLRTHENCRFALMKGWFHTSNDAFQPDAFIDQLKEIIQDIPKKDVLNRCCQLMDSLSLEEEFKASFLKWVDNNVILVDSSEGERRDIQESNDNLSQLVETWQQMKDEQDREDIERSIIGRLEQQIFHQTGVDTNQALFLIQFLNGEMGTLTSMNNLECLEKVRNLYDKLLYYCPMNVSIIRMAIHVEQGQKKQNLQRLRKLFDAWCELEGNTCIDCWLKYISLERRHNENRKVAQLYWKAMKMLQNKAEFIERFSMI